IVSVEPRFTEEEVIRRVISLNSSSEHPLAKATLLYGNERNVTIMPVSDFEAVVGKGVIGTLEGENLALGNKKLMEQVNAEISVELRDRVKAEQEQGKTVSYLSVDKTAVGFVVISDKIKESSEKAIRRLQEEGLVVIMLTGDNEDTARAVSETIGLNGYKAQMLPEDKMNEVKRLQ